MGVSETAAIFDGTAGVEVRFRARARDRAQNLEAWPPTADTSTTLYTWAIAGQASDNRGAPVIGMATTTTPAAFHGAPSDHDGAYAAHVAAEAASYSASWGKAGYGALPSTAFAPDLDASVDVVLPPADNVVQNWGFENGSSSWQLGGNLTAEVTDTAKHSGSFSALLGTHTQPLGYSTAVGTCKVDIGCESSVMDSSDTIHTAWLGEGDSNRRYKYKPLGEPWSTSTVLPGPWGTGMGKPVLTVDESMGVHALWVAGNQLYYSKKPPGMDWLYAEHVPTDLYVSDYVYRLAVNASGEVKVIWLGLHLRWEVYFSQRNANGSWTPKINITGPYTLQPERTDSAMRLAIDSAGLAHVLWLGSDGINPRNVFYAAETVSGSWLPAANISGCSTSVIDADMVIDSRGTAHVVWTCQGVNYRMRSPNATWLEARQIEPTANSAISLAVDRLDRLHLVWYLAQPWLQIRYVTFSNGIWSPPVAVAPPPSQPQDDVQPIVAVDDTLSVHVLWREGGTLLRYVVKRFNGQWSSPVDVYHVGGEARIQTWQLLADHTGTPHAIWMIAYGPFAVMYAGPETSATTGDAFMAQSVQIPSGASAPTLSFLYNFASTFPSNSRLEVTIDDSIAPTLVFSTTTSTGNWTHAWADLSPWAGHTVTLRFRVVEEAGGAQAGAYIDEVTVGSAHPDIWVSQPAWQAAAAGRTFETTLTYGNRGGVAASGGQVTLQLPAELSFVSAVPPPSATSPTLRWDVGALPAQSGPQTIRVTLQVAASATGGSTVSTTARVTSGTTELEQANNAAQGPLFIGSVRYLPVVHR
jgi:hypothetical protein